MILVWRILPPHLLPRSVIGVTDTLKQLDLWSLHPISATTSVTVPEPSDLHLATVAPGSI